MIPSSKCHRPVSEDENAMREGIIVHVMLPSWSTISQLAEVLKRFHAFYVSNRCDMFSKAKATVFTESGQPFCKPELHRKTQTVFLLWHGFGQLPSADLNVCDRKTNCFKDQTYGQLPAVPNFICELRTNNPKHSPTGRRSSIPS